MSFLSIFQYFPYLAPTQPTCSFSSFSGIPFVLQNLGTSRMSSIRGQQSRLNHAEGMSKNDSSINASQVRVALRQAFSGPTAHLTDPQLDGIPLIDLTADDELDNDHLQQALSGVNRSLRNHALDPNHKSVKGVAVASNCYIEIGQFVELREPLGPHKVSLSQDTVTQLPLWWARMNS